MDIDGWEGEKEMPKATVAICTAGRRPRMLKRCIESLWDIFPVDVYGWDVDILAVMNMTTPLEKEWKNVHYLHEPRMGLSTARNRAIEYCLDNNREWLIFIDDDTWVSKDWLENLVDTQRQYRSVNIFHGHISYLRTGDLKKAWIKDPKWPKHGSDMKCACTNNVMFNMSICKGGLRFDEAYNYTGGEDTDFFLRAVESGERIIYLDNANIYEKVPQERQTFKYYLWRSYYCAAANSYSAIRRDGKVSFIRRIPKMIRRFLTGALLLISSPLCIVAGKDKALSVAIRGINKLVFVAGSIIGITRWRPLPYKFKERVER